MTHIVHRGQRIPLAEPLCDIPERVIGLLDGVTEPTIFAVVAVLDDDALVILGADDIGARARAAARQVRADWEAEGATFCATETVRVWGSTHRLDEIPTRRAITRAWAKARN